MSKIKDKATKPVKTLQPHPDLDKLLDSPDFRPEEWVYERKFDGVRCLYDPNTDECYSRTGTVYKNFDFLKNVCKRIQKYIPFPVVFDGEVCGTEFKDASEQLFREVDVDTTKLTYQIFDIVVNDMPYNVRKDTLWMAMADAEILSTEPVYCVVAFAMEAKHTPDKIRSFVKNVIAHSKWEGVVFKKLDSLYEQGKKSCKLWVKGLIHHTEDLLVTGVVEGKGKLSGCVGKFLCDMCIVAPGKATHEQLRHWWEHREDLPKIIEVAFKSKTGKALRHPRFVRARYDKD